MCVVTAKKSETQKTGRGGGQFFHSYLVSHISTETVAGKSDSCRTARQFYATGS